MIFLQLHSMPVNTAMIDGSAMPKTHTNNTCVMAITVPSEHESIVRAHLGTGYAQVAMSNTLSMSGMATSAHPLTCPE